MSAARKLCLVMAGICLTLLAFCQDQPARFSHALGLFEQKKWQAAAQEFQAIDQSDSEHGPAQLYRAKCLINLNDFVAADGALKAYLALHPASDDAAYLLGFVYFREDKPKESLQQYTAAAKLKTPTADDLKIVSLDYVLLSDYTDAARYLDAALKMQPDNVEVLYHLGRVRYQQNRFDEAIAAFRQALKYDPANLKAQDNLGLSLEAENKIDLAIAAYRRAIELDSAAATRSEQPYLNLGILLTKSNRAGEALPVLATAAKINPKAEKVRYQLGKAYFDLGRFAEAVPHLKSAVELNAADVPSHYLLAQAYRHLGQQDLAKEQFKLAETLLRASKANTRVGTMDAEQE